MPSAALAQLSEKTRFGVPSSSRLEISRQATHWLVASRRLTHLDEVISPVGWGQLEAMVGQGLREKLRTSTSRLAAQALSLTQEIDFDVPAGNDALLQRRLLEIRRQYLKTETTLDFFADAINTRTGSEQGANLRGLDLLARRSMEAVLQPLGRSAPPVLTYIDRGLGASILKQGLRLWDGGKINPVAAIKIARHNLHRPTAILHETGHQVGHILGWAEELAARLPFALSVASRDIQDTWKGWLSEATADAFAFAHAGYASVVALHDVVAGSRRQVFADNRHDPHPNAWLRVMLGVSMCRCFGPGPWDALETSFRSRYPLEKAPIGSRNFISSSLPLLPAMANLLLRTQLDSFRGRSLSDLVDPQRVSPKSLAELTLRAGPALHSSSHWIDAECIRVLALNGLRLAVHPADTFEVLSRQRQWIKQLGHLSPTARLHALPTPPQIDGDRT